MRDHDLNIALLLLRNWLGLDTGLKLAGNEIVDELANVLGRKLLALVKGKLLVLGSLLDRKGGPFVGFKVEVGRVGAKGLGVDCGEAYSPPVLLGNGLEGLGKFGALLGGFCEDVGEGKTSLEIDI